MKPFPSYIQPDAMDCGPVSLKMTAKCYGKEFTDYQLFNAYALLGNRKKS